MRLGRIVVHDLAPEHVSQRSHTHRCSGMARVRLLHDIGAIEYQALATLATTQLGWVCLWSEVLRVFNA